MKGEPINIVIEGNPVPKGRPRFRNILRPLYGKAAETATLYKKKFGRYEPVEMIVSTYSTKETETAEQIIGWRCKSATQGKEPIAWPCVVKVVVYVPIPQYASEWERKQAEEGLILPVTKPDVDNYIKLILDGLNEIAFLDDGLVTDLEVSKRYSVNPRTEIRVAPLEWAGVFKASQKALQQRLTRKG
jgi:Holliday junction resolvase RusA-like endonuclease